jgi:hypothetical protein
MTEQKEILCGECGEPMVKHEGVVEGDVTMANDHGIKVVSDRWYECAKCGCKKGYKNRVIS